MPRVFAFHFSRLSLSSIYSISAGVFFLTTTFRALKCRSKATLNSSYPTVPLRGGESQVAAQLVRVEQDMAGQAHTFIVRQIVPFYERP